MVSARVHPTHDDDGDPTITWIILEIPGPRPGPGNIPSHSGARLGPGVGPIPATGAGAESEAPGGGRARVGFRSRVECRGVRRHGDVECGPCDVCGPASHLTTDKHEAAHSVGRPGPHSGTGGREDIR